jgi:hypothetical protein
LAVAAALTPMRRVATAINLISLGTCVDTIPATPDPPKYLSKIRSQYVAIVDVVTVQNILVPSFPAVGTICFAITTN